MDKYKTITVNRSSKGWTEIGAITPYGIVTISAFRSSDAEPSQESSKCSEQTSQQTPAESQD